MLELKNVAEAQNEPVSQEGGGGGGKGEDPGEEGVSDREGGVVAECQGYFAIMKGMREVHR